MSVLLDQVEQRVQQHPDKLLYSFLDSHGHPTATHTYESFLRRVDIIASHLARLPGSQSGERVLLVYPPGLEMICALFACARAGLIPVPTAPPSAYGFMAALYRLAHIARDCQAKALLTSRDCRELLRRQVDEDGPQANLRTATDIPWVVSEDLTDFAGPVPRPNGCDVFFLQYTSGSTSSPKGVIVTNGNVLHNCGLVVDHQAPIAVSWLPQHHDMGLLGYYIYVALSGGTTHGFSPTTFIQRPSLWLETITKYAATGTSAPNFAFDYCLRPGRIPETTLASINLESMRVLMAAAEPIKPETFRRFLQTFQPRGLRPSSFFVAYGLAENTLAVTNYGRRMLSICERQLSRGTARAVRQASGVSTAKHLISCGKPQRGNVVAIVDAATRRRVPEGKIGEVWVRGPSKCAGYWNNPELTREHFQARLVDDDDQSEYLRTGDVGFLSDGELFVCGRLKDLIIVRGQNYYPHDIESIVEQASPLIRHGGVAAFEIEKDGDTRVGIVAEVSNAKSLPDAAAIATAVRNFLNLEVGTIAFVPPKTVPKTSSGKTMRFMARRMFLEGQFTVLAELVSAQADSSNEPPVASGPFEFLKRRYHLTGTERQTLVEVGVDSMDLVVFVHEVKQLLESKNAEVLAEQVDFRLAQQIVVADLFELVDLLERDPSRAIDVVRLMLEGARDAHHDIERTMMTDDAKLDFVPRDSSPPFRGNPRSVLLTGGTGFLGPFLIKSLLQQTDATIHVLTRAGSDEEAADRLHQSFASAMGTTERPPDFATRVVPVCGDLEKPSFGLSGADWVRLARDVDVVYHNAAGVNYLLTYAGLRGANVIGTNEALRFAFDTRRKDFNYISTTFIFGWATKDVLFETDRNQEMALLDFGYSQSKWVAEQVVFDAARRGLGTRVFRPALITPSLTGGGHNFDITIRLLNFIIKHGITVSALNQVSFVPADVTATNIVAISNLPDTLDQTFHVTRDDYANMMDVTAIIHERTGRIFETFALRDFVPEVIRRCTKQDLLFPLLDFLIGSVNNISSMEFKRYDSSNYQRARAASPWGVPDPSLAATVGGILRFMSRTGILGTGLTAGMRESAGPAAFPTAARMSTIETGGNSMRPEGSVKE